MTAPKPPAQPQFASLDQLFDHAAAARKAYLDSPAGQAHFDAAMQKMAQERARAEQAPPPSPCEAGASAALRGEDRDAPAELDATAQAQWLAGYDSEADED